MPTYEYACKACAHRFEIEQSFYDDALTSCPECSGALRKVFSAAGIIFKGSGWHVKDYAGSSPTKTTAEPAQKTETAPETATPPPAADVTKPMPTPTTT